MNRADAPRWGRRALVGLAALVVSASACRRQPPVATLLEAVGTVQRSDGAGWLGVAPGFGFKVGDTLRTAAASSARLRVSGGGMIRVGENARLRFQRGERPPSRRPTSPSSSAPPRSRRRSALCP